MSSLFHDRPFARWIARAVVLCAAVAAFPWSGAACLAGGVDEATHGGVDASDATGVAASGGPPDLGSAISAARAHLKLGEYEEAASALWTALGSADPLDARLGEAWLALIQTYVTRGNHYKLEPQGRETAELYYKEARRQIHECLHIPRLRHLRPDPDGHLPPEMVELFAKVRAEIFGSFRIRHLSPSDAMLLFEGDTLQMAPGDSVLEIQDLPAGTYVIALAHPKRRSLTDRVEIFPETTTERSYALPPRRDVFWIGRRVGLAAAATGAVLAVTLRPEGSPVPPEPLPEPPDIP